MIVLLNHFNHRTRMEFIEIAMVATLIGVGFGCLIMGFITGEKRLNEVMSRVCVTQSNNIKFKWSVSGLGRT